MRGKRQQATVLQMVCTSSANRSCLSLWSEYFLPVISPSLTCPQSASISPCLCTLTHTHTHTSREKTNLPPVGIGIGTTGISVSDCTPVQYKYLQLKPFPYFVTDTSPHYKTHATVARFSNTFSKPVLLDRERMLQIGHCGDIIHWCVFFPVCV